MPDEIAYELRGIGQIQLIRCRGFLSSGNISRMGLRGPLVAAPALCRRFVRAGDRVPT